MIKDYFIACEGRLIDKKTELRKISLYLRREGILTMDKLCQLNQEMPEKLTAIRNIGGKSTQLIAAICKQYENEQK